MEEYKKYYDLPLAIWPRSRTPSITSESCRKPVLDPVDCWNLSKGEGRKIPGVIKQIRAKQFRIKRREDFPKNSRPAEPSPFEHDKQIIRVQEQLKNIEKISSQPISHKKYPLLLDENRPLLIDAHNNYISQTKKPRKPESRPLAIITNNDLNSERLLQKQPITPSFQPKKTEMVFESTGGSDDFFTEEAQTVPTEMSFSEQYPEKDYNFPNSNLDTISNKKYLNMPLIIGTKSLTESGKKINLEDAYQIFPKIDSKIPREIKRIRARQFKNHRKDDDCKTCRSCTPSMDTNFIELDPQIVKIQEQLKNIEKINSENSRSNKKIAISNGDKSLFNNTCYDWKAKRLQFLKKGKSSSYNEDRPLAIDTNNDLKSQGKQPITPSFQSKTKDIKFESTGGSDTFLAEDANPAELSFSEEKPRISRIFHPKFA
ncbi:unnamed protein product [Blepharisma stoltei]|uniref:Uncharacterized protein n=1 Tax=Blepharisma stoltei TaxID=1481888 RepID=A0AAU9JWH3_9CILI|nr:unnamed protein product [Blepharisma stoltei]